MAQAVHDHVHVNAHVNVDVNVDVNVNGLCHAQIRSRRARICVSVIQRLEKYLPDQCTLRRTRGRHPWARLRSVSENNKSQITDLK